MGGNAVPSAKRVDLQTYNEYVSEIKSIFHMLRIEEVKSYRTKADFGDIDLVVQTIPNVNIKQLVKDLIKPLEVYDNNCFYSFLYKDVQVDFIFTAPEIFDFSKNYYNFNDLGNFCGRIAHRQGLKFGHDGLWYIYRDGDQVLGEIRLSLDHNESLEYLGFDPEIYHAGFETLEDIFKYVVENPFFEPSAFRLEHRNHVSRVRDAKRKSYNAFLKHVNYTGEYYPSDKAAWLIKHKQRFPFLIDEINKIDEANNIKNRYKLFVNGESVMRLTGLKNKELGMFMNKLRELYPIESFDFTQNVSEFEDKITKLFNNV